MGRFMRESKIFFLSIILILSGCQSSFSDPAVVADEQASALCGDDTQCYQESYPQFYNTEVQQNSERRSAMQRVFQSLSKPTTTYTECETYGSSTSCSSY
jgi:hypothetical protein